MSDQLEEMLSELEKVADLATPGPWAKRVSKDMFTSVCFGDGITHPAEFIWKKSCVVPEVRGDDGAYIALANPAFAKNLIAAVRSALAPRVGELPPRPVKETIVSGLRNARDGGFEAAIDFEKDADGGFYDAVEADAHFTTLESLLRASQDEVEMLRGERDAALLSAKEWEHEHDAVMAVKHVIHPQDLDRLKRKLESAERDLTTCREDERKRCLEEAAKFSCPMCMDGLPVEEIADGFFHAENTPEGMR